MKKTAVLTFLFFAIAIHSIAQDNVIMRVEYLESYQQFGLKSVKNLSVGKNYSTENLNIEETKKMLSQSMVGILKPSIPQVIIKHYVKKIILKNEEFAIVKDSLNLFSWKYVNGSKNILGYHCKKAICKFRGRDYIAYYAPEISISGGPFKFNGLPGLILEIYSEDGFIKFTAQKIVRDEKKSMKKFDDQWILKSVAFNDYQKLSKKKYLDLNRKINSKNDVGGNGIITSVHVQEIKIEKD